MKSSVCKGEIRNEDMIHLKLITKTKTKQKNKNKKQKQKQKQQNKKNPEYK